ncbi:MAG: MFS transporter, partial [Holosporaceae bacterium]|nr:MFS transporter [Holosporaceae bacterium]
MKLASIWGDFIKTYFKVDISSRLFIGFSCGIPFLLRLTILDLWLKDCGISNTTIGFFTLLHWPFALKFLWTPFIEKTDFPFLSKIFGRRRGWAVASQFLLFVGLIGMANSEPQNCMARLMFFASLVAFADGCQDMSLYAYQVDKAKINMLGPIAGVFLLGYRSGMFFAKSVSLYLAHYLGWSVAYTVMAFSIFLCTFFILYAKEPEILQNKEIKRINKMVKSYEERFYSRFEFIRQTKIIIFECLICPFKIFMQRKDWRSLITVILLFRTGDMVAQKMLKPFFVDIGFSMLEIANVVQVFGTITTMVGGFLGGFLVKRMKIKKALFYTGAAHAISCFAYVILSKIGHNVPVLYLSVFWENITGGASATAFIAFLYTLCSKNYAATQYALLWAFYEFSGSIFRTFSGVFVDILGWTNFFTLAPILFIPSLIILHLMIK